MRTSLRWALAGTLLLTAAALLLPRHPAGVVPPTSPVPASPVPVVASLSSPAVLAELPATVQPMHLEPALRDPFALARPPVPPAAPTPRPTPVLAAVPVPSEPVRPVPSPPPQRPQYRYLGAVTSPAGEQQYFLAQGTAEFAVGMGTRLPSGHVVVAIGSNAIRVQHAETGQLFDIAVPPPQALSR